MATIYEKNLQALLGLNPELATRLFAMKANEKYEVFIDEKDAININIIDMKNNEPLYQGRAIDEVEVQLVSIEEEYSRYPIMFFYGVGNGVLIKSLIKNELHTRVVVVEPELELLFIVLNLIDFSQEIQNQKVIFLHSAQVSFALANDIFSQQDIKIFAKTYYFHINLKYYEKHYMQDMRRVNSIFLKSIEHIVRALGNDSTDALI